MSSKRFTTSKSPVFKVSKNINDNEWTKIKNDCIDALIDNYNMSQKDWNKQETTKIFINEFTLNHNERLKHLLFLQSVIEEKTNIQKTPIIYQKTNDFRYIYGPFASFKVNTPPPIMSPTHIAYVHIANTYCTCYYCNKI